MKILVVYFSCSGHTARVAEELAWHCGADRDVIHEATQRLGPCGTLRSLWQTLTRARPPILPTRRDPKDYDLVIIGTPVWARSVAAPVRSYITQHAGDFKRVAFFCTRTRAGQARVFAELQRLCGQVPVARVCFSAVSSEVPAGVERLQRFLARLQPDGQAAEARAA